MKAAHQEKPLCIVTGAGGFIGSTLAERLVAAGYQVHGIDFFLPNYARSLKEDNLRFLTKSGSFRFTEADLRHQDLGALLQGADYIVHLAAMPGVGPSWHDFPSYLEHNLLVTQRILEFLSRQGTVPQKIVLASSSSVYGSAGCFPAQENSPLRPISPYGWTKAAMEDLAGTYCRTYGLPVILLRYFTVYGPRQRPDMAIYRFLASAARGKPVTLYGSGERLRDFTYVDDAVEATFLALTRGGLGEAYNVGSGKPVSLKDLVSQIADLVGHGVHPLFTARPVGDVESTWADLAKAKRDLGYQPRMELKQGLAAQWKWMVGNKRV